MDRFVTRIPKPSQHAVLDQNCSVPIQEVQSNSLKQACEEKLNHEFKQQYFLQYKWLERKESKLFCKACSLFPDEWKKKPSLVLGWSGSGDGFKKEHFKRHEEHQSHEKCMQKYQSIVGTMTNSAGVPNVRQALSAKLNEQTKAELGTKFIAANFLAYHHIGIEKHKHS